MSINLLLKSLCRHSVNTSNKPTREGNSLSLKYEHWNLYQFITTTSITRNILNCININFLREAFSSVCVALRVYPSLHVVLASANKSFTSIKEKKEPPLHDIV